MTSMAVFIAIIMTITATLTWLMRRFALRHGLVDNPNARSSHAQPTPRGGGAAIVTVVSAVLAVLAWRGTIAFTTFAALGGGGLAVAIVGFIDDRRPLSTRLRLTVHFAAAAWVLAWLHGLPPLQVGQSLLEFGWLGYPLGLLGIVWLLNLFNFMDGIDGLAGSESGFVAIAGVGLMSGAGIGAGLPWAGAALGAACAGFLVWNWPPARIFLGDVGSGYLGFMVATLAILCAHENPGALWVFLILSAVFVVDATFTFLRRLARREGYDVAHRTHGYQRLARRWGGHRPVTVSVIITNLAVLLPAAAVAVRHPAWAAGIAAAVVTGLSVIAFLVGSGSAEQED